ncbi:aminoglycoside phosphotransferase family protein [Demequina sp. B12]|uniref:phosphotransferase n=1 Tax=Demequina sp. B12 TaxID=2992757 RepID=UPI00237AEA40|nr:phosphotransferase [Demequina sp. B12]MDE0573010.1 aminoglycoside phosphotransferase family protein [Demequina sp. B12]
MTTQAAAETLTGQDAGQVLATALATTHQELESWTLDAVHARPGAETSACYDVMASGERVYLVASNVDLSEAQRAATKAVRLESDLGVVHVWRHPADPFLPGLADACVPEALEARLNRAGADRPQVGRLEMLVLRPMRRAVLRAEVTEGERKDVWFVKVVRPERAYDLLHRHRLSSLAPRALDAGDGIVLVAQAPGVAMTEALHRTDGSDAAQIDPDILMRALDTLPPAVCELPDRPSVPDRLDMYLDLARKRGLDPALLDRLRARIGPGLDAADDAPRVPTHGDFHAANVRLDSATDPTRVVGLIDIDTLGPGRRADDLSCMVAHVSVLPSLDPHGYSGVEAHATRLFQGFAETVDEDDLRRRVAANIVALASGVDDLNRASQWLDLSVRVAEEAALVSQP